MLTFKSHHFDISPTHTNSPYKISPITLPLARDHRLAKSKAMASGSISPPHHVIDIRQDATEADDMQWRSATLNRQRRPRSIDRQVSLETGFAVLNGKEGGKASANGGGGSERKAALQRSGKSMGPGMRVGEEQQGGGRNKGDFSMFRTKSTLVKQMSMMPMKKESEGDVNGNGNINDNNNNNNVEGGELGGGGGGCGGGEDQDGDKSVPAAGRYFAALRGAELDQVRDSEDILLPKDELWPFLLRFPINCFGIALGLGSQAILWNALSTSPATAFLHISPDINLVIWLIALALLLTVFLTYALKCLFYFEAVRREYSHPVRVNFFFAPWIACMFLTIGAPHAFLQQHLKAIHPALCCVFIVPIFFLELKIYGQWLSGGKRRLSKVANPSSHLSVVGNFVGAILAANIGWVEVGKFLWAIGLAHYLVVFVTLYQRLPTSEALPKELHPVYSMFIATPSAASVAWKAIYGEFDAVSRTFYFIALFLYISLIVRINFFRGFRFSVAWWAYTFPMTTVSVATIRYAEAVPCFFSKGLAVSLSLMSSTMVSVLLVSTLLHAFVWRTLFPNDLAIAITKKKNRHGAPRPKAKEKTVKAAIDIKRWAKESSRSLVTSITKSNSAEKDGDRSQRGHV